MSAGICIMNKTAIALAADSAVTVGQHLAIHNSANKLFALSKVAPVGAIIYSNAEIMGIPIEIILKQYVQDFISFMLQNKRLFHFLENEHSYIQNTYIDLLNGLNGDYTQLLKRNVSNTI